MSLREPVLDNLKFQADIVDAARHSIVRYCPEWTDYNLSDPGITIAEMHAWMTEKLVYRLNQVPRKTHIRFLNLLGEDLLPAEEAKVDLTFYLAAPFPLNRDEPYAQNGQTSIATDTQVATLPTEQTPEIIFSVSETRVINVPKLKFLFRQEYSVQNAEVVNYWAYDEDPSRPGRMNPAHATMPVVANSPKPAESDVFYIGFDSKVDMRGYVLQLWFECKPAGASGVQRENPPWEWSAWVKQDGEEKWQTVPLGSTPNERDTTGGLNNAQGKVVLYLPTTVQASNQAAHKGYGPEGSNTAYWLRCQYKRSDPTQAEYKQHPTIKGVFVEVIGLTVAATHAQTVKDELLGVSDGEPGQIFTLQRSPLLQERDDAGIQPKQPMLIEEIERDVRGEVTYQKTWQQVPSFANSEPHDRHFVLDVSTGEISFGPLVQQPVGAPRQYGRVPAPSRELRVARYRYGGGRMGNVPARALNMLRNTIAFIDRVVNIKNAEGGKDAEPIEESLMRLRREMWSRRAVTAQDFEVLAQQTQTATPRKVARAKFIAAENAAALGVADVRVVPTLRPDDEGCIGLDQLALGDEMRRLVQAQLDDHRLLTTMLRVGEPTYMGVRVVARLRTEKNRRVGVLQDAHRALRIFLAPTNLLDEDALGVMGAAVRNSVAPRLHEFLRVVTGDDAHDDERGWQGWPFGKALSTTDLHLCLLNVPGVREVESLVLMGCRFDVKHPPAPTDLADLGSRVVLAPHEVVCSLVGAGLGHELTGTEGV